MATTTYCIAVPLAVWPAVGCILLFAILFGYFWSSMRGVRSIYFDPQDFAHYEKGGGRTLPLAAATGTFAPHLKSYTGATKLLVTVAAASIAFGANQGSKTGVFIAKIVLAFSILYGTVFSALLQFFYDLYAQDVRAYTPRRYALIQALGFSCLVCFIVGYLVWACSLG